MSYDDGFETWGMDASDAAYYNPEQYQNDFSADLFARDNAAFDNFSNDDLNSYFANPTQGQYNELYQNDFANDLFARDNAAFSGLTNEGLNSYVGNPTNENYQDIFASELFTRDNAAFDNLSNRGLDSYIGNPTQVNYQSILGQDPGRQSSGDPISKLLGSLQKLLGGSGKGNPQISGLLNALMAVMSQRKGIKNGAQRFQNAQNTAARDSQRSLGGIRGGLSNMNTAARDPMSYVQAAPPIVRREQ